MRADLLYGRSRRVHRTSVILLYRRIKKLVRKASNRGRRSQVCTIDNYSESLIAVRLFKFLHRDFMVNIHEIKSIGGYAQKCMIVIIW